MDYILFNPMACNGKGEEHAKKVEEFRQGRELKYQDMTGIDSLDSFMTGLAKEDAIILCGGDGTLNYFINHGDAAVFAGEIYYFPCGTGNDFYHDVCGEEPYHPIEISVYLKNLPVAEVKGKKYRFLNNVGFGIDGYCCQVGDELRAQHKEKINYTAIAIKGLLGAFKPVTATVTVDGETKVFSKAWLAPTMKGRYYGGGMFATPKQDRQRADGKVSVMLFHGFGKLKTLIVFPSIFKGEHVAHEEMVTILEGYEVKVAFDRPCALQVDGETILDVTEYTVRTR